MEEDIDYLKRHIKAIGKTRSTEAIENLINKYKEQEKMIVDYAEGKIFSEKQAEFIKKAINEEMEKSYKKELNKNYIPKILLEEELKIVKQEKEKCLNDIRKSIFCDGIIFELEDLLNFGKTKGE